MRSFNCACASALFRTAAKTVVTWPNWIRQMKEATKEHLPAVREIKEMDYPDFWDSPSFAHNLAQAFVGFQMQDKFKAAGIEIRERMRSKNDGVMPYPGHKLFSETHGLQKVAYNALTQTLFPRDEIKDLCVERAKKLFDPYNIFEGDGADFDNAFNVLKTIKGDSAMKVIKTWLNGWVNSHRMHGDHALKCLFGCGDGSLDSMNHYIHCPHLFAFQSFLFENVAVDPLIRFGIKRTQTHTLMVLSCLFSAYHALKSEVRSGKTNMHASGWIKNAWSVTANALKAEAGEMRISTRAFSFPKFIRFFTHNRMLSQTPPICDNSCLPANSCTNSCTHR